METICLKCLEKSPRRRYPSAAALADDLRRFRIGEPILARPVGIAERVGKWARRKKAAAALLAVSALFVVAVIGGAIWLAVGNARLAEAKKEADDANADLLAAKAESETAFGLATDTLDRIVLGTTLKLEGIPKAEGVLLETLAEASELNRQLVAVRPSDRGAVRRYALGLNQQLAYETNYHRGGAAGRTRAALAAFLAVELAKTPADADLRAAEVRLAFNTALAARAGAVAHEIDATNRRMGAVVEAFAADFPARPDARNFVVNKWWTAAGERGRAGDPAGQIAALEAAVAEARKFPPDDAGKRSRATFLVGGLMQLGAAWQSGKDYEKAEAAYDEAARECETRPDTEDGKAGGVSARVKQAGALIDRGKPRAALRRLQEVEPLARQLAADFPLNATYKLNLSECLFALGNFEFQSDPPAGLKLLDESIRVLDVLVIQAPKEAVYRDIRDGYLRTRKALADHGKKSP